VVRKTIISALIGAGVLFAAPAAHAVGMGKLTVLSGLGQPFRGEIELLAVDRSEEGSLAARLAPPEIFQQAKIERAGALLSLRFDVAQKQSGQWFIKLSSQNPVNEPFLDILVEVNWPSGKLLREYTILLDPPGLAMEQPAALPVEVLAVAPATRPDEARAVAPEEPPADALKKRAKSEPQPGTQGEYGPVKPGDTLTRIAAAVKPEGINTEQMLVALFRANQQAFSGNNMNRLKAGQILRIPDAAESGGLPQGEALKEIRAHTADWNAYRQKLAGMVESARPEHEDDARRAASGKITTAVEDKPGVPDAGKDVLKLSRSEGVGGKPGKTAAQDDAIAHEKALREANQRIAELEKNIKDMQRLLEINSHTLPGKSPDKPAEAVPPAQPAKSAEAEKPAEAAAPVSAMEGAAPAVVEDAPKPKPKPKVVSLQPQPEDTPAPSFIDELLGNPLALGGGALALLLGGLFGARALAARRKGKAGRGSAADQCTEPDTAELAAGAANFSAGLTDFTQTGMGSIDTADVDPIAEAEVYMAYGRDAQAEEILREAMVHDPQRHEIHLKLLEIYAARKDKGSYEALARQLYVTTGGAPDPDWEKAATMGRELDADNPLYGDVATSSAAMPENVETSAPFAEMLFGEQQEAVDASPDLDFNLDSTDRESDSAMDMPLESVPGEEQAEQLAADLDFNLEAEVPAPGTVQAAPDVAAASDAENILDFDLEMPALQQEEAEAPGNEPVAAEENLIDFDLDSPPPQPEVQETAPEPEPQAAQEAEEPGLDEHMLNFDLEMPTGVVQKSVADAPLDSTAQEEAPSAEATADFPLDIALPMEETAEPQPSENLEESAQMQGVEDFSETMLLDLSALEPEAPPSTGDSGADAAPEFEPPPEFESAPEPAPAPAVNTEEEHESILIPPTAMSDDAMLDFDFSLGDDEAAEENETPQAAATNIDLSDISLDLDENTDKGKSEPAPAAEDGARFLETATKLDLAKAYMEMGDKEGAREILQEVRQEGSDEQQEEAGKLLAQLD
jgi:pilus assembly protein FimV